MSGVHRAYCVDLSCEGCVPSDERLAGLPLIALWGEMVERCVAQTPATKTREGALAALVDDGPTYRELVARLRAEKLAAVAVSGSEYRNG